MFLNTALDIPHVFDSLSRGMYMNQLEPFVRNFPASQLLVMRSEDFVADPTSSFRRVARFLGIDDGVYVPGMHIANEEFFGDQATGAGMAILNGNNGVGGNGHWNGKKVGNGAKKLVVAMAMEDPTKDLGKLADSEDASGATSGKGKKYGSSLITAQKKDMERVDKDMERRLDLATRYRLQKVFRPLNKRLIEMFEGGERDFRGWEYDVDRG